MFRHVFVQSSNCNPGCCSCMTQSALEGVLIFACCSRGPTNCPTQWPAQREPVCAQVLPWSPGSCALFRPFWIFVNIPCSANLSIHHVRSRLRAFERLWRARKCYIVKENRTAITVAVVVNATAVSATKVWQRLHRLWILWPMTIYLVQMSRGKFGIVLGCERGPRLVVMFLVWNSQSQCFILIIVIIDKFAPNSIKMQLGGILRWKRKTHWCRHAFEDEHFNRPTFSVVHLLWFVKSKTDLQTCL